METILIGEGIDRFEKRLKSETRELTDAKCDGKKCRSGLKRIMKKNTRFLFLRVRLTWLSRI